jgi:hypothetical protein
MGVGSGYSQKDVQELARILTGVGVDLKPDAPKLKPQWQPLYVREGLFEFNPARHDFGDKQFLGHTIKGSGFHEVEQALDLIAASPATAHHVSLQLATYFTGDNPPPRWWTAWPPVSAQQWRYRRRAARPAAFGRVHRLAGQAVQGPDALCRLGGAAGLWRPGGAQHRSAQLLAAAHG